MDRRTPRSALLAACLFAVACGGEAAEEAQPAEMEVASASALECYVHRGTFAETQDRPSPLLMTEFAFTGGEGLLCYGAPSARNRVVMDSLVPYGAPWRVGANEPTTIHLSAPASIGGVALEPGSYSIYAVPGADEWEFFINTNWQRWGIPISDEVRATEIGSFTATPMASEETVETLSYEFSPTSDGAMGDVVMTWENTQVQFHVHPGG